MNALEVSGLFKSFGEVEALKGVDLNIEPGAFFGLLGPNGAGKSTLMSIISGFHRQDTGAIRLFGQELDPDDPAQKSLIGLAPQHIALYKELSAEANLDFFGRLSGLSGHTLKDRVEDALTLAQLTERRKSRVKDFSGGMKRRLNIAVALLHHPKILLCDEPTVGVDPQSRNAIFDTLEQLRGRGMTVVYSTHYMEEAERLCDRIGIIDHGRILSEGTLDALLGKLPSINEIHIQLTDMPDHHFSGLQAFGNMEKKKNAYRLRPNDGFKLSEFYLWLEQQQLDTRKFQARRPNLENLFLQLTGRELRE